MKELNLELIKMGQPSAPDNPYGKENATWHVTLELTGINEVNIIEQLIKQCNPTMDKNFMPKIDSELITDCACIDYSKAKEQENG